jgi:S-adenosylmethionine:tRNA ribosyltransferase-isomerase
MSDLPHLLHRDDLLVLNETKVVPARLSLRRETGGRVEALLVRPELSGWRALVRPARRLHEGETLEGSSGAFRARIVSLEGGQAVLELQGLPVERILEAYGRMPLPLYIRREANESDRERYQTIFARVPGSIAAPTAGLHFDEALFEQLAIRGVELARLVLHVGTATFRPLPPGDLSGHRLGRESVSIPEGTCAALKRAIREGRRIVAAGTTVVRALESWARAGEPSRFEGETDLFIQHPFEFRVVRALLTNFHLPRSSLLCLVMAFAGCERVRSAYEEAIRERYRFYSYGDATFFEGSACSR